ncbi:MAG: ribosome biogenesis GTP-binding protein YsxC [Krumholzibacteria bacterium]|nr:ribosome biogenesis GTP-binding protein YsxC [Candidatus Krumholzibacteria bacterium]
MDVRYVTGAPDLAGRPLPVLPEFAFIGRSNCGKSSLINLFLGRRALARTSGTPGKTRLLNYYLVDGRYYLVDLPGYGYARVSKTQRAVWHRLFQAFLAAQDRPLAVFQLLDVRHRPTADDKEVAGWIRASGHPWALAVTKIDKVGTNRRRGRYQEIIGALDAPADTPFFPTSIRLGAGADGMHAWVDALLAAADGA